MTMAENTSTISADNDCVFQVRRSPQQSVDHHLLISATTALQSQEKFFLDLREKNSKEPCPILLDNCTTIIETMRAMKSQIEGTAVDIPRPVLEDKPLQKLKTLTLMHMPRTMTTDVKHNFLSLIEECLKNADCKLVYAGLSYCPWYVSTQPELGQQAKHSTVLVVFTNPDHLTFSAANPHNKEQTEVIDEGWFYAVEASHFAKYLVRGKSRMVETLFSDNGSVIYASPEWNRLLETIDKGAVIKLKPFLEQCRGQAIGGVAKKSKKTGRMKLNDSATLYEFCESFGLLNNAVQALTTQTLNVSMLQSDELSETVKNAHDLIKTIYMHESDGRTKEDVFDLLLAAKADVDALMKGVQYTESSRVEDQVASWMRWLRAGDNIPRADPGLPVGEREKLVALMQSVGGPVATMSPEQIVVIVRAGSFIYGLSTPESDIDYLVVYVEPTQNVLASVKHITENRECRGPNKEIEYGAYEARLFAEMLLKGSIVTSEIVYVGEAEYASAAWRALCSQRHLFVTEHVIQQYFGLIGNNMHTIRNDKYKGAPRERKLFYQIFHKLWSVEAMLEGRPPPVRCAGDIQEFIMSIRKGPLEGELSRENLYTRAEQKLEALRRALTERPTRLPENADLGYLTDWLMTLRGWTTS